MKHDYARLFDVAISKMDMQQTVSFLAERVEQKQVTQVITANPIMMMAALRDRAYMQMMQAAELVVPDGTGLVWAVKHIGQPVRERVPGIELMMNLLAEAEQRRWAVYFLGASPEIIAASVNQMRQRFPRLIISGFRDGYFGSAEDATVVTDIKRLEPQLLFVGRSASLQEPWIAQFKQQLEVPIVMGVGGSFDVISGKLKRAPKIWQSLRLEWLYRLLQEPWRYKRMLDLPRFVWRVWRSK